MLHKLTHNVCALPKCRKLIPAAWQRRNFIFYGAILKLNRITRAEITYPAAGILAMQLL
jgi:hypothetical protein